MNSDAVLGDFGIKVAMNICDQHALKRVQYSIHEAVSTRAEKQISVGSSFSVFNIDDEREFLRTVAGAAKAGYGYIESFSGAESITIKTEKSNPLSWTTLIPRLHDLGEAYAKEDYKEVFVGYDKFHFEKDRDKIAALDELVFEEISSDTPENVHLAPPEFFDFENLSFMYDKEGDTFSDLTLSDLLDHRKRKFTARSSIKSIKDMKIHVHDAATDTTRRRWSAYKCLVAEVEYEGDTYILSTGQWKQISQGLKEEVDQYLETIPVTAPAYVLQNISIWDPEAKSGRGEDREDIYNAALANASADLFLFDKAKVQIAGEKRYEICDLLHSAKIFIQVKRFRNGAASISHLFLQGRFYADAFVSDPKCPESMRAHVEANAEGRDVGPFTAILPADGAVINRREYVVLFCIITDIVDFQMSRLPFMARYELMHTHRHIARSLGFQCKVTLPRIILGPPD